MGVCDPSTEPKTEFDRSQRMVSPIFNANGSISQKSIAMEIQKEKKNDMQKLQILIEGASSWLNTLHIEQKGFHLSKRVFQDAIAIRYGRDPMDLPRKCSCIPKTNVIHALECKIGVRVKLYVPSQVDPFSLFYELYLHGLINRIDKTLTQMAKKGHVNDSCRTENNVILAKERKRLSEAEFCPWKTLRKPNNKVCCISLST
ncbi:hypothetical protein GJ496_010945 [Pomphorhynchus laevis]|nr:hypothetical protein GJ496_010945 [Pomphorhynchus laevis]